MICFGCLEDKTVKNGYCPKCTKLLFNGISPKPLSFDKVGFYKERSEMASRMSISGVQDKLSLRFEKETLVPTAIQGKYILKPIPNMAQRGVDKLIDIAANEHVCMRLSKDVFKINTAECGLIRFSDGELAYLTKRFDYVNETTKYDQEDFAAILNVTPFNSGKDYKYDARSYLDCANKIRELLPAYMPALEEFFKRIVLNYLIGNADAHLKNFSIYRVPGKNDYQLTPNYDVLNTRYHIKNENTDTGLILNNEDTSTYEAVGFYTYADFKQFADLIHLPNVRFQKIIAFCEESTPAVESLINRSFLSDEAKEFFVKFYKERLHKRLLYIPRT